MMLKSTKEGSGVRYSLLIDDSEKLLINFVPGDREFIGNAAKSPLVSEKLVGLALIAKRIEEGRKVADVLEKAQQQPTTAPQNPSGN